METKKWYQSKTLWAAIYIIGSTAYKGVKGLILPNLPDIPPFVDLFMDSICGVQVVRARLNSKDAKPIA